MLHKPDQEWCSHITGKGMVIIEILCCTKVTLFCRHKKGECDKARSNIACEHMSLAIQPRRSSKSIQVVIGKISNRCNLHGCRD